MDLPVWFEIGSLVVLVGILLADLLLRQRRRVDAESRRSLSRVFLVGASGVFRLRRPVADFALRPAGRVDAPGRWASGVSRNVGLGLRIRSLSKPLGESKRRCLGLLFGR